MRHSNCKNAICLLVAGRTFIAVDDIALIGIEKQDVEGNFRRQGRAPGEEKLQISWEWK